MKTPVQLILIRHGESQWNQENRFTGWQDVDLSSKGVEEAMLAGVLLKDSGIKCELSFTSFLLRAIKTLWLTMEHSGQITLPITPAWQLNERHYGALTGLNKVDTAEKYGEAQVKIWRRSYDTRPPLMDINASDNPAFGERYAALTPQERPLGESLADTVVRVSRYFIDNIAPSLKKNKNTLIVAHGNSLRALIKYLENTSEADILELNVPTGVPMVYTLLDIGDRWQVLNKKMLGSADDIAKRIAAVDQQGKK